MMNFLLTMNIFFSLLFLFLNHPISLGSILLIQTIILSLITGNFYYSYWFSYILFLVMIGGMLILFIYMTSVASNEKFLYKNYLLIIFMTMLMCMMMMIFMDNFFFLENNFQMNLSNTKINITMNKLTNFPSNFIYMMMMIYLLICLIAVVKITKFNFGPLRQKF